MPTLLHCALALLLASCGSAGPSDPAELPVYLWAGQSNAKALASVDTMAAGDERYAASLPAVRYAARGYGSQDDEVATSRAWSDLQCFGGKIGMEMAFGHSLVGPAALIKFTIGSSVLQHWVDAARDDEMLAFFAEQLALLGQPYYPAGFIWIQGESEGARSQPGWSGHFTSIVSKLREAMGRSLPVYVVETQTGDAMSGIQHEWVASDPHAAIIETPPYEGSPHWWMPSLCRIGEAIAAAVATPP